jgi:hypothetical protein
MPTKSAYESILTGPALLDAANQRAQTPRGGEEFGFDGSSSGKPKTPAASNGAAPTDQPESFAGMGPWLEDDDETVFKRADHLVLRQELVAQNHLAQDIHYTRVKLGCPFSTLEKDADKGTYRATLPAGTKALTIQAVPNKAWDLVNKATETVLVDPAQPDPTPLNDSEEAENAADMAEKFLTENAGENGTNDIELFTQAVDKALICATAYIEAWVDPVGGGCVPLQILAHPQATDPANPLVGPDGMPTAENVLRYVTAPQGGQFTEDPSQAAPQWQPKIRGTVWGREHWRIYPESQTVQTADKAIGLLYTTLGEAKKRWPTVAAMGQDELNALLSWTPPRFLVLLPPYQRARWKISAGSDKEKAGSSDERLMFYYRVLQKAEPDHPRGAEVIVTGANDGQVLDKKLLAATVPIPGEDGTGTKNDVRCMDLPLVQVTPRSDPDERDPTGRAYMELFAGATEFNAALATGFLEALNQWLHPDSYIPSTSSVQGYQVDESRATGDMIPILRPEDKPTYGNMPPLPSTFWQSVEWNDRQTDSIASLNKPVTGADNQQEVSGKARQIAVQQAMVGLSRMQAPVNAGKARWCRIVLQQAMRDYTTPQIIRYEGEDGAYKATDFTGVDFALVGDVAIKAGTGTMMPPEAKVNYIGSLAANGMLPQDEAADAARPSFAGKLGLPANPHEQYIERCIDAWLQGPPPEWDAKWQAYQQQLQQYQQAMQAYQTGVVQPQQEAQLRQQATVAQHGPMLAATHQAGIAQQADQAKHQMATAAAEQAHGHAMQQKAADMEVDRGRGRT